MDLGQQIGANLKQLRTERGLTLGQLSSLAGISKAMLSELEKGNANPTINTLWKIANGLKVPYTRLMEGAEPTATLVRREEVFPQTEEGGTTGCSATSPAGPSETLNSSTWSWTPMGPTPPPGTWPSPRSTSICCKGN